MRLKKPADWGIRFSSGGRGGKKKMLKEMQYSWVAVDSIAVPCKRRWSRLGAGELEALIEAIKEHGPDFCLERPISMSTGRDKKHYILSDGYNWLQAFREFGYQKIHSRRCRRPSTRYGKVEGVR